MPDAVTTDAGLAPGIYTADEVPADAYHADPALSSTGARRLLECPAKFAYEREHGQAPKKVFDIGQAAHLAVLGAGPDLVVVDARDWKTKAAQQQRDQARADGAVPLLIAEYEQVQAMAEAIRQHPFAGPLFAPDGGQAEVTLVWDDPDTGIRCRARVDWLRNARPGWRLVLPDLKTTTDASPDAIAKSIARFNYHQQDDWYRTAVRACGLAPNDVAFVLLFQEKTPPYVITPVQIPDTDLMLAAAKNRHARELYRDCTASGIWPGYADEPIYISLPTWASIRDEEYL